MICAAWAELEYLFFMVIWRALNLDDLETGPIVTGGLDMLGRANMAIRLIRHKKAPRYVLDALVAARKTIQDGLDDKRNRAIHGTHVSGPSDGEFILVMHRGKFASNEEPLTAHDLKVTADEIIAVSAMVRVPLMRWLGAPVKPTPPSP